MASDLDIPQSNSSRSGDDWLREKGGYNVQLQTAAARCRSVAGEECRM